MYVSFPENMNATFLNNQTVLLTGVTTNTFTASFTNVDYVGTETDIDAMQAYGGVNPASGSTVPTWSTVVPSSSNNFAGGVTLDGQVKWVNRGSAVKNWGIAPPTSQPLFDLGASSVSWGAGVFYSLVSVVVDSNGNLQQVTTPGLSGSSQPTWATTIGLTTSDGQVTWTMIQTVALGVPKSLTWEPNTEYTQSTTLNLTSIAVAVGGSTVYSGAITGGADNAFVTTPPTMFVITGAIDVVNNGVFSCTASTTTSITLTNPNGVSETSSSIVATIQGSFVIGNAYGTSCLFMLGQNNQPSLTGSVKAYLYAGVHSGSGVGRFTLTHPTSTSSALASTLTQNSLDFAGAPESGSMFSWDNLFGDFSTSGGGANLTWDTVNAAGEVVSFNTPFSNFINTYELIILATLNVPVAGTYTFSISHYDGMIWGIGNGATSTGGSGYPNNQGQVVTAAEGYPNFGGTNGGTPGGGTYDPVTNTFSGSVGVTDTFQVTFPAPGNYPVEVDYSYWYHDGMQLNVMCNGDILANTSGGSGNPTSGTSEPIWPSWTVSNAPLYPTVTESSGQLTWYNLGPVTDFSWAANTTFTLPDTTIVDPNGYEEAPYRTGVTGAIAPTFSTGANSLTYDNPNLIWINEGIAATVKTGTLSTFNGGWTYWVALVDTLDDTVSNCSPASQVTGNFIGINGVFLEPGSGLPDKAVIDPQSDYVAIFRSTDGQSVPLLIPGQLSDWTVPLSVYLTDGYTDKTLDVGLNNEILGAIDGENTPPGAGAINLTYHLDRIWYSIGNVVYWTTGPATPCGNGINGTAPLNFSSMPSLVKRIVPTASGAFIFTVSDIYIIQGNGTAQSPIQGALPMAPGVGLLSYNALDLRGTLIGFFTTDNQFVILNPENGISSASLPIGDQFRLTNGNPGQNWNPANVYVAWHVEGEDQAWYVGDGATGWYKLMDTPAPESGNTWSPYSIITGGAGAIQSVEVTPGVHRLLVGPTGTGSITQRDLTVYSDSGTSYPAYATIGSVVLAQPGQIAEVAFITTESIKVGSPLVIGLLVDECLPYYTGPIDILKVWVNDPPNLKPSSSLYSQRFYLSELKDETAAMRHCQLQIIFSPYDTVANELLSTTIFGTFSQEL
jgi:hypothetical protein